MFGFSVLELLFVGLLFVLAAVVVVFRLVRANPPRDDDRN
jgi:hypothetical protein